LFFYIHKSVAGIINMLWHNIFFTYCIQGHNYAEIKG